jgi:hypothetical protein
MSGFKKEADGGVGRGPGGPPHMARFSMDFRDMTLGRSVAIFDYT